MNSEGIIKKAYEACTTDNAVMATMGIVVVLAVIFFLIECISIWRGVIKDSGSVDVKKFFELAQKSIIYMCIIPLLPICIYFIESAFSGMQDDINKNYSSGLNLTVDEQINELTKDYLENEATLDGTLGAYKEQDSFDRAKTIFDSLNPFEKIYTRIVRGLTMGTIYIYKYLYFTFCCGRYLWLILLQITAPVAIICSLRKETQQYFHGWLKNMFCCYMLLPAYLIANVFSEKVIEHLMSSQMMNQFGLVALISLLLLKLAMFGVVTKRVTNLL